MLLESVLTAKAFVTLLTFDIVNWGIKVLLEGALTAKAFVAVVAFKYMYWRV